VAEDAIRHFISNEQVNVEGLVVAGPGGIKDEFLKLVTLDRRLLSAVIATEDTAMTGRLGFFEAVKRTAPRIQNLQIMEEQRLITTLLTHMASDTGLYVVGLCDTLQLLESGCVKTLLVCVDNDFTTARAQRLDSEGRALEEKVRHTAAANVGAAIATIEQDLLTAEQKGWERVDTIPFNEWLVAHADSLSADIEFISSASPESLQLSKGLGGIAGILRYPVDITQLDDPDEEAGSADDDAPSDYDSDA